MERTQIEMRRQNREARRTGHSFVFRLHQKCRRSRCLERLYFLPDSFPSFITYNFPLNIPCDQFYSYGEHYFLFLREKPFLHLVLSHMFRKLWKRKGRRERERKSFLFGSYRVQRQCVTSFRLTRRCATLEQHAIYRRHAPFTGGHRRSPPLGLPSSHSELKNGP